MLQIYTLREKKSIAYRRVLRLAEQAKIYSPPKNFAPISIDDAMSGPDDWRL